MSENGGNSAPTAISYTRKRTTTKTRTAASSARRRKNIPICHASGGGGGDDDDRKDARSSWFARKSAGWTDAQIKSHLVSGGADDSKGGGGASFGIVGDMIQGLDGSTKQEKRRKTKRRGTGGTKFAWQEDDEDDGQDESEYNYGNQQKMVAAPTVMDIMDEQDEIDFMSPLKVSKQYQMKESVDGTNCDDHHSIKNKSGSTGNLRRQNNAALAELAQVSGVDHGGGGRNPTSANESIGLRLLRVCGYRSRLGMAFVPLSGHAGGKGGIEDEVMKELDREGTNATTATHEAKWLASKRLRAIRLPSIQNVDPNNSSQTVPKKKVRVLTIPPPKMNRHGIGYDPFKNAPEFREFHERRRALAQKRGRGTDDVTKAEGGKRGDRYFTDDLKNGRERPWDKTHNDGNDSDGTIDGGDRNFKAKVSQHSHYAADRNYSDFIGTKASSGFALQDEDDANVYQDDGEGHSFPRREDGQGGDHSENEYAMEVQSPLASEEEDNAALDGGLFGKSATIGSRRKLAEKRPLQDKGKIDEAWSVWGVGVGQSASSFSTKITTMDGKPPLSGFTLSQSIDTSHLGNQKPDASKRWKGPMLPSGYVLKRHVFPIEDMNAAQVAAVDRTDSGLGLDLQRHGRTPRSIIPKVLPPSSSGQKQNQTSEKMLARDGTELNFHAVRESMKNRFVSSTGTSNANAPESADAVNNESNNSQNMDKEEWVRVTVTPWMPTRLLCKRWGVPVPSTAAMSAATGEEASGGRARRKEEDYFRQTIYEPALAVQRQKGEDMPKGSNVLKELNGEKVTSMSGNGGHRSDNVLEQEEDAGPPPDRPSNDVFQAIFDAESDMDISSSSEDDNGVEQERDGQHTTTQTKKGISAPNGLDDETNNSEKSNPNRIADTNNPKLDSPENNNNGEVSTTDGSDSYNSHIYAKRRKRRHHHRRSRNDPDDSDEDRTERKRGEKHRRKHHRRRRHSGSESDGESDGCGSDDYHERKKSKKHRHRSRSRHRRRKK